MELHEYVQILRKRWATVVLAGGLVVLAAAAMTLLATPQYVATTRLFFAVPTGGSATDLAQGSTFTERQMSSYAEVATSPLVLGPVLDELGLDRTANELARSVRATVPLGTVILEVTATDDDPEVAARVANAVGAQLSDVVADLYPARENGAQAVLATTLTPASVPQAPASPNVRSNLAIGLVLGILLGVGLAVLREALDTKIRSERDVGRVTDRSILGAVVFDPGAPQHPVVMQVDPQGQRAESIRRLRTNLQFVDVGSGPRSILVTSSVPGEGKTTTAVNLAVALADAGSRVLLVDADLRRPSLADVLGLEGAAGLTTVLIGRAGVEDVVQRWGDGTLDVLTSGPVPPNPSELLGSAAMTALVEDLASRYDIVLLDSAPLLPVTDAAVLSRRADGTLVVVGTDRIHRAELQRSLDALAAVDARVLGLVLNKVAQRELSPYGSSYAYTYARATEPPSTTGFSAAGDSAPGAAPEGPESSADAAPSSAPASSDRARERAAGGLARAGRAGRGAGARGRAVAARPGTGGPRT